jgi:hypothetical protein
MLRQRGKAEGPGGKRSEMFTSGPSSRIRPRREKLECTCTFAKQGTFAKKRDGSAIKTLKNYDTR